MMFSIYYYQWDSRALKIFLMLLLSMAFRFTLAQPYVINTNSSGGIQNSGGISVYNLSAPAGTAPEFYDHGESFTGQPGDFSSLVLASDGYIYGHTEGGGEHYSGTFFRIDPSTNTVTQLFSFDYNEHYPIYNMVEHNQILYGIMRRRSSEDVVFAIKLSDPTHLISLTNLTNIFKIKRMGGGFYKLNNKLYATIFDGLDGSNVVGGGVYEYDLATGNDRILCSNPYGYSLASGALAHRNVQGRDRLVVANSASPFGGGGFYEVDAESGFIHEITVVRDRQFLGDKFSGVFRNSSGTLFSRSFAGGSTGVGTLVSIDPDGRSVAKEFTFGNANGTAISGLVPHGHNLIGMTQPATITFSGPDRGVIYQYDRHGNYKELYHFKDSSYPTEFFIITDDDGGTMWGITEFGGKSNQGAIFKYQLATNKMEVIASFGSDTGFIPETRLTPYKDGKFTFSNRDGGINNYGTLASFDPSSGNIGHLYSTGNNSLAKQGYSNGAFLASNGKYYAIERTGATAYDVYKDSLFYRDRLVEFNDDLDSVIILSGRFKNRLFEATEKAPYNIIGEIIEIQGKLVFTYTNFLYTYDLSTGQFTELIDLRSKRNVDNNDAAWDWGFLFSSSVTKKDDDTYYYSTQGSGENVIATHGGTILKLDVSSSPWVITHEYTIDVFVSDSRERTKIELRVSGKGEPGIKGKMLILPGAGGDPDTLVAASEYNSPTTMGCILAYPMGENGNRIGASHIIKQFPETGFDTELNSVANDSTHGWFPMSDLAYHDNKIYGFTKGGETGNYVGSDHRGTERGTPAFQGTFWSIDRGNSDAFELLYTLDQATGTNPLQTSVNIVQLSPITGQRLNADTLGCDISTRTFKVYGHDRGDLQWWSSNPNVTLVAGQTNGDSATFDFSALTSNLEQTTTISVSAYNANAASGYQYGDTASWDVHQFVQPSIGDIQPSVDLHCPTQHARLTLSSYAHVDSFYWELPTDIIALTSLNGDELQVDLSREGFGTHRIVCHAFNGCGQQVSDTLTFDVYDPNAVPTITNTDLNVCIGGTINFTATASNPSHEFNWTLPTGAVLASGAQANAATVEVDFTGVQEGTYPVLVSAKSTCGLGTADTAYVHVSKAPVISELIANKTLSCGDSEVTIVARHLFANGFSWTIPDGAVVVGDETTDILTLNVENVDSDSINISVTATNACAGTNSSNSLKIAIPASPSIGGITVSSTEYSVADTVQLTASNVTGGGNYNWNIPEGCNVIGNDNEQTIMFTVREANVGDHTVSVQASNDCGASNQETATIRLTSVNSLENELSSNVLAYPNPSNGTFLLQGLDANEINIVIRNTSGQVVESYTGIPKEMKFRRLQNGQYFVNVYTKDLDYGTIPVIINK
ncbi:choice-of-anchor tandem repeat GloVer-containing protein [Flammeovirga sp. SubArs3]|uniref:choice-of-anchor tandem repeat GloVer-containing protein n=1 Tax=Flammeovirga sp. SubArs3 TaxID=2995316 RepID=UPI00248B9BAF|nr:choice-of-anchor tandem repeat GloVer-containing protein [Flammeovirga sp. SubArs3]